MKKIKILIAVLSFVSLLMIMMLYPKAGASWKYEWSNTTIVIPVGESVEDYKQRPVATLYRDGIAMTDANISYNRDGDWLYYMKNVDTTKTGTYYVWYKAYDSVYIPGTCTDYKCLITFIVKDSIKPTLRIIEPEIYVPKGGSYELSDNVVAGDNYTASPKITFAQNIDYTRVGVYPVTVNVSDEATNYVTGTFKVVVYEDAEEPIITCSAVGDDIYIPYDAEYDIKQYFKATDLKDGDITDKIYYPTLDNLNVGDYEYTVYVVNSADLKTEYTVNIHVVDDEAPSLVLTTNSLILDYSLDFDNQNYMKYIRSLTDNFPIDYDNLSITYNMENKVGSYNIYYSYTDGVYTVSDTIDVSLVSYQAPKISVSDISVYEEENINLMDYISITDESDPNAAESVQIDDSEVVYDEEGTYYATVFCMNSSGLSSEARFKIIVESKSWFSKANVGIMVTAIILFTVIVGASGFLGFYLIRKKKKSI